MSLLRFLLPTLLLCATAAAAAPLPKLAGTTILAGCRQGECRWLRIAGFETAGRYRQGELRRMRARTGTSYHPDGNIPARAAGVKIAWLRGDGTEYAFCSTVRPAYAFTDEDGKLVIHFLDLFDLAGYQYASAQMYMRLCHGRGSLPSERVLRGLGYRAGTRSAQVEGRGVEAMTRF